MYSRLLGVDLHFDAAMCKEGCAVRPLQDGVIGWVSGFRKESACDISSLDNRAVSGVEIEVESEDEAIHEEEICSSDRGAVGNVRRYSVLRVGRIRALYTVYAVHGMYD